MFHLVLNGIIVGLWIYVGVITIRSKLRRMRSEKDGQAVKVHKGELVQYALVYAMMMLLLLEKVVEAAAKL